LTTILIDRDSVCAGDDVEAHVRSITVDPGESLEELICRVLASRFLAQIGGGKASWIAIADANPVAVIAQQWSKPAFLEAVRASTMPSRLHFAYHAQRDPDELLESVATGRSS
jgi:hypothetical protein